MKKTFFLALFFCVFLSVLLSSCEIKKEVPQQDFVFPSSPTVVGIRMKGLKSFGTIHMDEAGYLHFRHEDPTSPLFGMEEITDGRQVKVLFQDIAWESEEAALSMMEIKRGIDAICPENRISEEAVSLDGVQAKKTTYQSGDRSVSVWSEAESGALLRISVIDDKINPEINFIRDDAKATK